LDYAGIENGWMEIGEFCFASEKELLVQTTALSGISGDLTSYALHALAGNYMFNHLGCLYFRLDNTAFALKT